jgi:phosphoglycerate kinase
VRTVSELADQIGGLAGRRILVRSDLNVPLDGTRITDDGRIRASASTIQELSAAGARVVVTAHLGRPKGAPDPAYSLAPVATRLGELVDASVMHASDTVGSSAKSTVGGLADGDIAVLENVRFNPGETSKDDAERGAFADRLAELADAFVSDGFGVVHRKQASVYDVAQRLPHAAGGLVLREVDVLRRLTEDPARPYAVVLGGSKVSDKLAVIEALAPKVDTLVIGGGMCFTFLAAQGLSVGTSLLQQEMIATCQDLLDRFADVIHLPVDIVAASGFSADADSKIVPANEIPDGWMGLDIGPKSVRRFAALLTEAKTVFWNGPMGVFEFENFAAGTRGVAEAIVTATGKGAFTVVGGGDSAAAVRTLGLPEDGFSHISTGGGASLEYLEGKDLPGIAVLED